jgi:hypothetical protein
MNNLISYNHKVNPSALFASLTRNHILPVHKIHMIHMYLSTLRPLSLKAIALIVMKMSIFPFRAEGNNSDTNGKISPGIKRAGSVHGSPLRGDSRVRTLCTYQVSEVRCNFGVLGDRVKMWIRVGHEMTSLRARISK